MAWLNGWSYRRAITVDNTGNAATLTNYAVKIALTSSNMTFANAQSAGQDIRFTDSDGTTLLQYWFDADLGAYSSVGQTATIWVKVPSITGSASQTIYLYYGNAGASDAQSISGTFTHGNDYTASTPTRNYATVSTDGVHYSAASLYSYDTALASGYWLTRPKGCYDATGGKTYFMQTQYVDSTHQNWIIWAYDHAAKTFSSHLVAASPSLDPHAGPSVSIDGSGFLYVIGATESSQGKAWKSTSARDITAWTDISFPVSTVRTYTSQFWVGSTLFVFCRDSISDTAPTYQKRYGYLTWNGSVWSAYTELINFAHVDGSAEWNPYVIPWYDGTNIHLAWGLYENAATNYKNKLWYMYSSDGGATWKKRDGTGITLPATATNSDNLNSSTANNIWVLDVKTDGSGNPHILTNESPLGTNSDSRSNGSYCIYNYSAGWHRTVIAADASDNLFDGGALVVDNANNIKAYLCVGGELSLDGGQIWEYVTSTGPTGTWTKNQAIYDGVPPQANSITSIFAKQNDLEILFSFGDASPNIYTTLSGSVKSAVWGRNNVVPTTTQPYSLGQSGESLQFTGNSSSSPQATSTLTGGVHKLGLAAANDCAFVYPDAAMASIQRYVRFKTHFSVGPTGNYRMRFGFVFAPVTVPLSLGVNLDGGADWALGFYWLPTGLRLDDCSSRGGTPSTIRAASGAAPTTDNYLIEFWHPQGGSTTFWKITDLTSSTVVFDGTAGLASLSLDAMTLVPTYGMYTNDSANTLDVDNFILRQFSSPEPVLTAGAQQSLAGLFPFFIDNQQAGFVGALGGF